MVVQMAVLADAGAKGPRMNNLSDLEALRAGHDGYDRANKSRAGPNVSGSPCNEAHMTKPSTLTTLGAASTGVSNSTG
jgi:hypothetical protein